MGRGRRAWRVLQQSGEEMMVSRISQITTCINNKKLSDVGCILMIEITKFGAGFVGVSAVRERRKQG